MHRFPPVTLWLYILGEMWKLIVLTTGVLVTVIAFAAAVKPLADGKLDPFDTLRFMFFAIVPMLQYSLPFAACFGATLAYHRLAADNELTACYAGGISHRSVLMPAIGSGVVLGGILLVLSNYTIPLYLKRMAELVTDDASKIIVNSIEHGEAISLGDGTLIYADQVRKLPPDPASGDYQRLWLGGLLVVKLDHEGKIASQGSARTASVWMHPVTRSAASGPGVVTTGAGGGDDKPVTEVLVKPTDFVAMGETFRANGSDTVLPFTVPNAFGDNVKFLSFSELRTLRGHPEKMDFIDKRRRSLALALAERQLIDDVRRSLRDTGQAEFLDPFAQRVVLHAGRIRPTMRDGKPELRVMQVLPAGKDQTIVVERYTREGKLQKQTAASAYLRLPGGSGDSDSGEGSHSNVLVTLQLREVKAEQVDAETDPETLGDESALRGGAAGASGAATGGEARERPLADLTFASDPSPELLKKNTSELEELGKERVADRPAEGDLVRGSLKELTERVADLRREILSKEHERFAMSAACLVMVLIGAVMAMRLRDALPLMIYVWAFFPALLCVVLISGGQQVTHGQGAIGLLVIWSGVIGLGAFAGAQMVQLVKH